MGESDTTFQVPGAVYARGRYFSRNPTSGTRRPSAEVFLDPAAPQPLPLFSLSKASPEAVKILEQQAQEAEGRLKDAVELDFELRSGELRVENARPLKRSAQASVGVACALVREEVLSPLEAITRVTAEEVNSLLRASLSESDVRQALRQDRLLAQGVGCGGAISGVVAFDTASAWREHTAGHLVVLVCERLTYLERDALAAVSGVIVARGSLMAASQFERPGVVLPGLEFRDGRAQLGEKSLSAGDRVALDGNSGQVFTGEIPVVPGRLSEDAVTLLGWCDQERLIALRANAGSVEEAEQAVAFGASGVGLCRIETLLQRGPRLAVFQQAFKAICSGEDERFPVVASWASEVKEEAIAFFRACQGFPQDSPITVRLFDAPMASMLRHWRDHTELPTDYFIAPLSAWLEELNPLQGLRGGRLSLMFPELMKVQVRALLRAWQTSLPSSLRLQIMMPGVTSVEEVKILKSQVESVAQEEGVTMPAVGSMLELPRACLTAGTLCEVAEFLSFGTGDLTEATCGISRYDAQLSFLSSYVERGILERDPFQAIDQEGVGALMRLATDAVKTKSPAFELGTCGAQAIDPSSLEFCCRIGLRYVSVPAHCLPVARLVAAQVALKS